MNDCVVVLDVNRSAGVVVTAGATLAVTVDSGLTRLAVGEVVAIEDVPVTRCVEVPVTADLLAFHTHRASAASCVIHRWP